MPSWCGLGGDGASGAAGGAGATALTTTSSTPIRSAWIETAMANAADVTFKEVVRDACLSRDHFMAWTDAADSAEAATSEMFGKVREVPQTECL